MSSGDEMYLVRARLLVGTPISGADLRGYLSGAAVPEDGLEHVYAEAGADEARLVLFLLKGSASDAALTAARLCRRTLASAPRFADWRLVDCAASPASAIPAVTWYDGPQRRAWQVTAADRGGAPDEAAPSR